MKIILPTELGLGEGSEYGTRQEKIRCHAEEEVYNLSHTQLCRPPVIFGGSETTCPRPQQQSREKLIIRCESCPPRVRPASQDYHKHDQELAPHEKQVSNVWSIQ
jgi:hypothetical protein